MVKAVSALSLIVLSSLMMGGILSGEERAFPPPGHWAKVFFNVTFEDDSPVDGALIEIKAYHSSMMYTETGVTNSAGKAMVNVTGVNWGPCWIQVKDSSEDHFIRFDRFISPDEVIYLDIVLPEHLPYDRYINGTLRYLNNGLPVSGSIVRIQGEDSMGRAVDETDTTDGSGQFHLTVPYSASVYSLTALPPVPTIDSSEIVIQLDPASKEYFYELYLRPTLVRTVPISIGVYNSSTMKNMTGSSCRIDGTAVDKDMSRDYVNLGKDPVSGRFEGDVMKGSYNLQWESVEDTHWNISYYLNTYIYVNDTPLNMDIPMDTIEDLRGVRLEIWKDSGPLGYCHVDYYHTIGSEGESYTSINMMQTADSSGRLFFGIPAGEEIRLSVWYYGYREREIVIPPGTSSEPVELNVTLEKSSASTFPMGNISLKVIDGLTGIPVPRASISASAWDEEGSYHSYFRSTNEFGYSNGTLDAVTYSSVDVKHSLGYASAKNVTIAEGETTVLTVALERWEMPESLDTYILHLADPEGNPVSGVPMRISPSPSSALSRSCSDSTGRIVFHGKEGEYNIHVEAPGDHWFYSPRWQEERTTFHFPAGGGDLGTLTLYPLDGMEAVEGSVLDSSTMDPVPFANIHGESFHPLEGGTRDMCREYPWAVEFFSDMAQDRGPGITLFTGHTHSVADGYYRVWGKEKVYIRCSTEGYFPYQGLVDLTTRAGDTNNILLDPIPPATSHIVGMIQDENGNPIPGTIYLIEQDHPDNLFDALDVGENGTFDIRLHPASYRIIYGNETLHNETLLEVNESGIEDLILPLIPYSYINGTVTNGSGAPLPGFNVSLYPAGEAVPPIDSRQTDGNGNFSFLARSGDYRIEVNGTDQYLDLSLNIPGVTGWNDIHLDVVLYNRTSGNVEGVVRGDGGPLEVAVPNASVMLRNSTGGILAETMTDSLGHFVFNNVQFGSGYYIIVEPPSDWKKTTEGGHGYLNLTTDRFDLHTRVLFLDLVLEYIEPPLPGFFNVTLHSPVGTGVLLDEPVRLSFSDAVNSSYLEGNLSVSPLVGNLTFRWNGDGTGVVIDHDDFRKNTTYTVTISGLLTSSSGKLLWGEGDFSWNFTTGDETGAWNLITATVETLSDRTTFFNATGDPGLTVHVVIEGKGSYMLVEAGAGIYSVEIPPGDLEWDTEYFYHFSDVIDGPDLAPDLAGSFRTAARPSVQGGDDDDDDTSKEDESSDAWKIVFFVILVLLILAVLTAILVLLAARSGKGGYGGEEE